MATASTTAVPDTGSSYTKAAQEDSFGSLDSQTVEFLAGMVEATHKNAENEQALAKLKELMLCGTATPVTATATPATATATAVPEVQEKKKLSGESKEAQPPGGAALPLKVETVVNPKCPVDIIRHGKTLVRTEAKFGDEVFVPRQPAIYSSKGCWLGNSWFYADGTYELSFASLTDPSLCFSMSDISNAKYPYSALVDSLSAKTANVTLSLQSCRVVVGEGANQFVLEVPRTDASIGLEIFSRYALLGKQEHVGRMLSVSDVNPVSEPDIITIKISTESAIALAELLKGKKKKLNSHVLAHLMAMMDDK